MSDEAELRSEIAALRQQLTEARRANEAEAPSAAAGAEGALTQRVELSSQALPRSVFDGVPDALLLADDQGVYVDANTAACDLFGLSRDELVGKHVSDFAAGGYDTPEAFQSFLAAGRMHGDFPLRRADGTTQTLDFSAVANVAPGLHLATLRDISKRVAAEQALRNNEVRFRAMVDGTEATRLEAERTRYVDRLRLLELSVSRLNDIVLITKASPLSEPGPEIVYVNQAFERITGYKPEEAIGKTPRMLQGPDTDLATLSKLRAALERAEPVRVELVNYTKAGVPYWIEMDVAPVHNEAGELTHFVAIERDITEQTRTQEELRQSNERLRQAQKMEAIGNLAGGVAHDFNNLLSVILSYTSLIREDLLPADPLAQDLDEIHNAGLRATALTRHLLAFSRKQVLQPGVVEVNAVVQSVEKMLQRLLGEDIELALHTSTDAGKVYVDPSQLEQVLMNLIVNSRDAMPQGGNIMIETAAVVLDDAYAASHSDVTPGPHVLIAVTDTGSGMDRATQARIFEPFFTTKEQGKGTGLGLSTVYGIVQQSGGHIWVYSEPGHGTTFKIYLPRTDRVAEPVTLKPEPSDSLRGTETILLVEDETPVRNVMRNILSKHGYHVLEAQNGGEGFMLCEQFSATIHLLLTDVVMPRMSGRQLAERLLILRPQRKVLFVSGYTQDTIVHHGVLDAGLEFLPKPILPDPLLRKVRQVLDGSPRRSSAAPKL